MLTGLWWGILKERDHLEYLGVDGRIFSYRNRWDVVNWINVNQVESKWQVFLKSATNFLLPQNHRKFLNG